jgi:hypothetical protein
MGGKNNSNRRKNSQNGRKNNSLAVKSKKFVGIRHNSRGGNNKVTISGKNDRHEGNKVVY